MTDDLSLVEESVPLPKAKRGEYVNSAESRLLALNDGIAMQPDAAGNYVLRGELLLQLGEAALAAADFRAALELTAAQLQTDDWGFVTQALHDRALTGLKKALRRLNE